MELVNYPGNGLRWRVNCYLGIIHAYDDIGGKVLAGHGYALRQCNLAHCAAHIAFDIIHNRLQLCAQVGGYIR